MATQTAKAINKHRIPVSVNADHTLDGRIVPRCFCTEDGLTVPIDAVLDVREAPALKAGGQGLRYVIRVCYKDRELQRYLFHDRDVWFIEKD